MKNITQSILLGLIASFSMANSAIAVSFNWTGDGGYSATGSFDYNNLVNDDFVRSSDGELVNFQITFFDNTNTQLVYYDQVQLLGETNFNFNYDINSGQILQSGESNDFLNGFSIGKNPLATTPTGYVLESSSGGILFTDNSNNSILDSGGTLDTVGVPFEFSPSLGFIISGGIFGGLSVIKRFYKK